MEAKEEKLEEISELSISYLLLEKCYSITEQNNDKVLHFTPQSHEPQKLKYFPYKSQVKQVILSKKQLVRYEQKKVAAQAFINRGYGIVKCRQEMQERKCNFDTDITRYKNVATAFMCEVVRKMEIIIKDQLGGKISTLNNKNLRSIYTSLLNCKKLLSQDLYNVFVKYIKIAYELEEVSVALKISVRLFETIFSFRFHRDTDTVKKFATSLNIPMNDLWQKSGRTCLTLRGEQSNTFIWARQYEQFLVYNYIKLGKVGRVKEQFKLKFGDSCQFANLLRLKTKLRQLMRDVLRRIQEISVNNHGNLVPMSVKDSRSMFQSPHAIAIRFRLCELWGKERLSYGQLGDLIKKVNDFVLGKRNGTIKNTRGNTRVKGK